jgi:hypothetical protein
MLRWVVELRSTTILIGDVIAIGTGLTRAMQIANKKSGADYRSIENASCVPWFRPEIRY